ncbi:CHAT domain-containing protein [Luteolibacter marinus]|uniref:CHAT domain-containing protein n=1 Tax=Luteolibacter marinus TaxID=2776705 RepID=UPI001D00CDD1|nr:CHAT domain-containing tetratricopeptide repeat protein [Luteolibacter marinus]
MSDVTERLIVNSFRIQPALRCLAVSLGLLTFGTAPAPAGALDAALEANDFAEAEVLLEQLVADWEKETESSHDPDDFVQLGLTLQALGTVERQLGKPEEAVSHLDRANEQLSGADGLIRADAIEALALTLQDLGNLDESEQKLREILVLRSADAPGGPATRQTLDHLALNLLAQGRYPEAGDLLLNNLRETPDDEPQVLARRLEHYGRYLHTLGSYSRAIDTFQQALDLRFDDPELRLAIASDAALSKLRLGKISEARLELEEAVNEAQRLYQDSSRPFLAAPHLINLGALDLSQGLPQQAAASFATALEILRACFPPDHPSLIVPLNNLGCAEQAAGNYAEAEQHLRQASELQAKHLPRLHLRVAETARNLARNGLLAGKPAAGDEIKRATALGVELLGELIHHGTERERLNFLQRLDLVSLPCATGDPSLIADTLIASKARLLDTMLDPDSGTSDACPDWKQIQASLHLGSAFIDTCRYAGGDSDAFDRYGAILLLPEGPPRWIPLGSEEDLQRWLEAFRGRLAWRAAALSGQNQRPPTLKLRTILRSLDREFWQPIADQLPAGTQDIAYSPDGALHFLPLASLLDESQQLLCARYRQVTTVSSARDLLRPPASRSLNDSPWTILGVSNFPKRPGPAGNDPLLSLLAGLAPMPGTRDESRILSDLAPPGSRRLLDQEATEAALHQLPVTPGVLHLGCHAFFLPANATPAGAVDFDEHANLLYSGGLLLYQAARRGPDAPLTNPDDDLLFPSEVADLPLEGTRLVTLSSCESGAGTAVSGEGLLGLRRGFALAGAREIVVALWPVSDRTTAAFMERFYRLALASDRPAQALWQCQCEHLTAAAGDDEFEAAVLRFGPFMLSQNTPLAASRSTIEPSLSAASGWWRFLLPVPLLAFAIARLRSRKRVAV